MVPNSLNETAFSLRGLGVKYHSPLYSSQVEFIFSDNIVSFLLDESNSQDGDNNHLCYDVNKGTDCGCLGA